MKAAERAGRVDGAYTDAAKTLWNTQCRRADYTGMSGVNKHQRGTPGMSRNAIS